MRSFKHQCDVTQRQTATVKCEVDSGEGKEEIPVKPLVVVLLTSPPTLSAETDASIFVPTGGVKEPLGNAEAAVATFG